MLQRSIPLLLGAALACSSCASNAADGAVAAVGAESPATPDPAAGEARPEAPAPSQGPSAAPVRAPGTCAGPVGVTLRTLVVGNSQIYFQNLPKLLSDLSASGPPACPRIAAEGFTHGGKNLWWLWTHGDELGRDLRATLKEGRYDVVVIAESIDLVELLPPQEQFVTYATLIIDAARALGAMPVLYATPYVDKPDHWGFVEMAAPQIELGRAKGVPVAAGGLAWLRVWRALPDVKLHHPDYAHPGYKGSIISSMVIYSVITQATPIGLTTTPPIDCDTPRPYWNSKCPPLTPAEGEIFQRAAWEEAQATGGVGQR